MNKFVSLRPISLNFACIDLFTISLNSIVFPARSNAEILLSPIQSVKAEIKEMGLKDFLAISDEKLFDGLLNKYMNVLTNREREIISRRYGLNNTQEYTQKEVASLLGISQSYISRIEKKVLKRLKLHLE